MTRSEPDASFGNMLRQLRIAAGLTQEALAERAGLSLNAISALERGERRRPYPRTIQALADALGLKDSERNQLGASLPRRVRHDFRDAPVLPPIPVPTTPLFGRDAEIAAAAKLLGNGEVRLLTLTGPGGVGKSRLALGVAMALDGDLTDAIGFISLAPVHDDQLVAMAMVQAIGLEGAVETEPRDLLVRYLQDRKALLLLDNFEQVAGAALLISDLLARCPRVQAIVTSRVSLHVDGEQEFPVPPLPAPPANTEMPLHELGEIPAVALFVQRARTVRPSFALTDANAKTVAEICARLDGLPLAIELAAARSRLLSPQAILGNLSNRLAFLTGGGPDRPPRLQTMRGAIAWSVDHLGPDEQKLFRRLSVFVGGCMLDAVGPVICENALDPLIDGQFTEGADPRTLDLVAALIDHSLLLREENAEGDVRIDMLETIREYGRERLAVHGEEADVRNAHARYFLAFARLARQRIEGPERRSAHDQVGWELDNFRAALNWLHEQGDAETAHRLVNELARFWIDLGYIREGRRWIQRTLALTRPVPYAVRVETLYWGAGFADLQDDADGTAVFAEEALALARTHAYEWGAALALTQLGAAAAAIDIDRAQAMVETALDTFRATGHRIQEGMALRQLGLLAHRRGAWDQAAAYHTAALAIWRELDHPWGVPAALRELADESLAQHDLAQAQAQYQESLLLWRQLGERLHVSDCLSGLARVGLASGQVEKAALLLGAKDKLDQNMGYVPARELHAALVQNAREVLGEDAFAEQWESGRSLSLEDILDEVMTMSVPDQAT